MKKTNASFSWKNVCSILIHLINLLFYFLSPFFWAYSAYASYFFFSSIGITIFSASDRNVFYAYLSSFSLYFITLVLFMGSIAFFKKQRNVPVRIVMLLILIISFSYHYFMRISYAVSIYSAVSNSTFSQKYWYFCNQRQLWYPLKDACYVYEESGKQTPPLVNTYISTETSMQGWKLYIPNLGVLEILLPIMHSFIATAGILNVIGTMMEIVRKRTRAHARF